MGYSPWGHKEPDTTEWLALFTEAYSSNDQRNTLLSPMEL